MRLVEGGTYIRDIFYEKSKFGCPSVPYIYTAIVLGGTHRDTRKTLDVYQSRCMGHTITHNNGNTCNFHAGRCPT